MLDAYELAFDGDLGAIAAAAPRIEHASVLSGELIARMAAAGVAACIQPSFAVTDAARDYALRSAPTGHRSPIPGPQLARAGVALLAGSDYPIEALEPLPGLARLAGRRSLRPGFDTAQPAPERARLAVAVAFGLMSDPAAGRTLLTADPRTAAAEDLDSIEVLGTEPVPFW